VKAHELLHYYLFAGPVQAGGHLLQHCRSIGQSSIGEKAAAMVGVSTGLRAQGVQRV